MARTDGMQYRVEILEIKLKRLIARVRIIATLVEETHQILEALATTTTGSDGEIP